MFKAYDNHYFKLQSGVAFIEFTLIFPILCFLCLAVVEIGYAAQDYNLIVQRLGLAGRFLSTRSPGQAGNLLNVQCLLAYGIPSYDGRNCPSSIPAGTRVLLDFDPNNAINYLINITMNNSSVALGSSSSNSVRISTVNITIGDAAHHVYFIHRLLSSGYMYTYLSTPSFGQFEFSPMSITVRQAN